jgi:hypothetical protein
LVPDFSPVEAFSNDLNLAIPVLFNPTGAKVGYIRSIFPPECFPQATILEQVRIIHQWGEDTDTPVARPR